MQPAFPVRRHLDAAGAAVDDDHAGRTRRCWCATSRPTRPSSSRGRTSSACSASSIVLVRKLTTWPSDCPIITGYEKPLTALIARSCSPAPRTLRRLTPPAHGTSNLTTPNGPMTVALTLKKDGEKLSGTIAGPQGEVAVQGTQKDKAVDVNFSVQTPNGPFAIVMAGNQDGDAIAGTMDFGGQGQAEWTGKRRAARPRRRRSQLQEQRRPTSR